MKQDTSIQYVARNQVMVGHDGSTVKASIDHFAIATETEDGPRFTIEGQAHRPVEIGKVAGHPVLTGVCLIVGSTARSGKSAVLQKVRREMGGPLAFVDEAPTTYDATDAIVLPPSSQAIAAFLTTQLRAGERKVFIDSFTFYLTLGQALRSGGVSQDTESLLKSLGRVATELGVLICATINASDSQNADAVVGARADAVIALANGSAQTIIQTTLRDAAIECTIERRDATRGTRGTFSLYGEGKHNRAARRKF